MSTTITIIGLGGAGGRAVERASESLPKGVDTAVLNTDTHELAPCGLSVKLQVGAVRTGGVGCGGDAGIGRLAAEDDIATIRGLVRDKQLVYVVAGLGGGTGSGGAPAVLRAAREEGALTIALVTLPFAFEGEERKRVAQEALAAVREAGHVVVVVPNERLLASTGQPKASAAFEEADRVLGAGASCVATLLTRPGYLSLDFAKLKRIVGGGGTCAFGYAEVTGEDRAASCVAQLLDSPLLDGGATLERAPAVLIGIMGGADLTLQEIGDVMDALGKRLPAACETAVGTHLDAAYDGRLRLVVMAAETWGGAAPVPAEAQGAKERPKRKGGKRGGRRDDGGPEQTTLGLDLDGRGRFKNVEPTILDGENLDVPTFLRRGIKIGK